MKRGFATNELLVVIGLFAILFGVSLPFSTYIGWGTFGAFPLAIIEFILVFCLLNASEIFEQVFPRNPERSIGAKDKSKHKDKDGLA
jgi:uncharacterized membrane protein